jgi:pSer/pThr/pTyr-binding forkhead associated (FHA) protein
MSGILFLGLRIILAIILYAFLCAALYILWRNLYQQNQALLSNQPPILVLNLAGADIGQIFRFTIPEVVIGREPTCDCHLDNPTISARHARLAYHHRQWWVEDLDSRNGTYLNQDMVDKPLVLTSGDQLRCGQVVFQITLDESNMNNLNLRK